VPQSLGSSSSVQRVTKHNSVHTSSAALENVQPVAMTFTLQSEGNASAALKFNGATSLANSAHTLSANPETGANPVHARWIAACLFFWPSSDCWEHSSWFTTVRLISTLSIPLHRGGEHAIVHTAQDFTATFEEFLLVKALS
jgi:hypothetical protein